MFIEQLTKEEILNNMTPAEMRDKLVELGFSLMDSKFALITTNYNFEEAKELLYLYTTSEIVVTYKLLKLMKSVEKLEKLLEGKSE
jgi:hypothetical protein